MKLPLACATYRQVQRARTLRWVCIFFATTGFLTPSFSSGRALPLETRRDRNLAELLLQATNNPPALLLSEKTAQMNSLRNKYLDVLNSPDFVLRTELSSKSVGNSASSYSAGTEGLVEGVFQFGGNWRSDFSWGFSADLRGKPALTRHIQSSLPVMDTLTLSYGRERSVESTAGLLNDFPMLTGSKTQPVFSGLNIKLHPKRPRDPLGDVRAEFEIEHAWSEQRNAGSLSGFSTTQRTRPKLSLNTDNPLWSLEASSMLEWYTDPDGIVGRIIAGRRMPAIASPEQSSLTNETRWRPLFLSLRGLAKLTDTMTISSRFARISNPIGDTTVPAWGVDTSLEKEDQLGGERVTSGLSLQVFRVPLGAMPMMRLPVEINPGTKGGIVQGFLSWLPSQLPDQVFSFILGQIQEDKLDSRGWLHCQTGRSIPQPANTAECKTWWFSVNWALISATNL